MVLYILTTEFHHSWYKFWNWNISASKRDTEPNKHHYNPKWSHSGDRAWFEGLISSRFQNIGQKGHSGCPLGSIWAFWNLNEIITSNFLRKRNSRIYGGGAWFQDHISFRFQDSGQNGHFGCPLGLIWAFWDLN